MKRAPAADPHDTRTSGAASARPSAREAAARAAADAPGALDAPVATEPGTTRALIWRLQSGGWSPVEAGNLAAIALGVRPARTGWTGFELDHLRFLKSLVSAGRVER